MGRLVITHSSYIDGLIPVLKDLSMLNGIKTITPAVIKRIKGRNEGFTLKVTIPIKGGYKLIARKGRSVQEVFVITDYNKDKLEQSIKKILKC